MYAVECEPDACALIRRNREKFAAWNLSLIEGRAPAALEALPAPDAVFIGGTKGSMATVVDTVLAKNANALHLHCRHCAGIPERRHCSPYGSWPFR